MMRLVDLAWGSLILAYSTAHDAAYLELVSCPGFLHRLQTRPLRDDVDRLRRFLQQGYGVQYMPASWVGQCISIWPELNLAIDRLSCEKLQTCDLDSRSIQESIRSAFALLTGHRIWGGDTVASKVLHFLNPSLFVMWDEAIKGSFGKAGQKGT